MSSLTLYQDDYDEATIVSNLFIDKYMKDANDAQLKIYLYLIRMLSSHKVTSISDIADQFNYTEKDIIRALKYWEKNKLLYMEYDESKNPVSIHLQSVHLQSAHHRTTGESRSFSVSPAVEPVLPVLPGQTAGSLKTSPEKKKPSYSLDELKAFKEAEETSQLLFVAEQYLGKTLSATEIKTILFISDSLKFSMDLIDYLIQYCVERGKKDFRYIEKVALSWSEAGITNPRQAAGATQKYEKIVYDVMKALGKNSVPTKNEADYILRWYQELGFTPDIIFEACTRTVMATDHHRFEYCNTILMNWKAGQVHHKTDIKQLDAVHARAKIIDSQVKTQAGSGKFNQFKQNQYDFDALEKEILSN